MEDYIFKKDLVAVIDRLTLGTLRPIFKTDSGTEIVAAANYNEGVRMMNAVIMEELKKGGKDEA